MWSPAGPRVGRGVCLVTERFCGISEVFGFSCACRVSEDARSPLPVRGRAVGAGKAATGPRSVPGRGSRRGWSPKLEHRAGLCDGKRPDPGSVAAGLPGFLTAGPGNPSLAARADSRSKFSFSRSLAGFRSAQNWPGALRTDPAAAAVVGSCASPLGRTWPAQMSSLLPPLCIHFCN